MMFCSGSCLADFVWVIGDLFQQYAAKYLGISRGIPLSNTNQLWGLLWGLLVFGELHGMAAGHYARDRRRLVADGGGSRRHRFGIRNALANTHTGEMQRSAKATRYGISDEFLNSRLQESSTAGRSNAPPRSWMDWLLVAVASGIFLYLASVARTPQISFQLAGSASLVARSSRFASGYCGGAVPHHSLSVIIFASSRRRARLTDNSC